MALAVVNVTDANSETKENAVDQLFATADQHVTTVEAELEEFARGTPFLTSVPPTPAIRVWVSRW